eukprot:s1994_g8.t1
MLSGWWQIHWISFELLQWNHLKIKGAYAQWLVANPLDKLRIAPVEPPENQRAWLRVEQRGSLALLKALPESIKQEVISGRNMSAVSIIFKETVSKSDGVKTTPSTSSTVTITEVPEKGEGKTAMMGEVAHILKSLSTSVKAIRLESMGVNRGGRALLDGGATHILRPPANELELSESVKDTGTLLAENVETQVIIPLGKLAAIGYKVKWDERGFELASPEGDLIDVELEAGCPTVDAQTAQGLIEVLEKVESEISLRVKALAAGDQMGLSSQVWRWMEDFKNRYP